MVDDMKFMRNFANPSSTNEIFRNNIKPHFISKTTDKRFILSFVLVIIFNSAFKRAKATLLQNEHYCKLEKKFETQRLS